MRVVPVPDDVLGFDCYEPLSLAALDILARASYDGESFHFVVRYVENLTVPEIQNILDRQLGLMTVGVAPDDSMHAPSAILRVARRSASSYKIARARSTSRGDTLA